MHTVIAEPMYRSLTVVSAIVSNMAEFWMGSVKPYEGDQL